MVVYADILVLLNLLVDYFILSVSSKFLKEKVGVVRILTAAAVGALSSLYIFLPPFPMWLEVPFRIALCLLLTLICFGFKNIKRFCRCSAVIFAVTAAYGGFMIAIWLLFKPNGMVIHNSVVYFSISPTILILFSVVGFFVSALLRKLLAKTSSTAEKCTVELSAEGRSVFADAIIDTGNSLEDVFGMGDVIIADRKVFYSLFGDEFSDADLIKRYRALPCNTISGSDILDGYRLDFANISCGEKTVKLKKAIMAISRQPLAEGCEAIVNPDSVSQLEFAMPESKKC